MFLNLENPNYANGSGFLSLRWDIKYFETYSDNTKGFKDCLFLLTCFNEESHANISKLEPSFPHVCMNLFHKYWS